MKSLIVEDDFTSRKLMQKFLAPFGDCDIAVNGKEALLAFKQALQEEQPYDLVCLDIMMPEMDGQAVLKQIRQIESRQEIEMPRGSKVIMTTALHDGKNVMAAFKSLCNAYLVKPVDRKQLIGHLLEMELIEETSAETLTAPSQP